MNLSIVIPYYGCEGSLMELCNSIKTELAGIQLESEVIFILDGPSGGSWEYLQKVSQEFGFLCFQLTRNFGQHAATKAGLSLSTGSMVIVMDCDLQDPPSLIPILIESASEGVDVVFAKRDGKYDGIQRRVFRKTSNFFLSLIYPKGFDLDTGSYMLLKRPVVDQVNLIQDNSHVGLLVNWLNYPSASVRYLRDKRSWGKSSYSFQKLIRHGMEALSFNLTYFFRKLLSISVLASIILTFLGLVALMRALMSQTSAGWASVFILLTIGFSITLTMLSLIGFTLTDKVSNRNLPPYLIREDD